MVKMCLIYCLNNVNNDHQQDSRVLYAIVPNNPFCNLLELLPTYFIFLKIFKSKFHEIDAWFTDQDNKPLEINRIDLTVVII